MKSIFLKIIKEPIIYIIAFCTLVQIGAYNIFPDFEIFPDSLSYVNYTGDIEKGILDKDRTPGYPYFIKSVSHVGGTENLYKNIVIVQSVIFLISIVFFYYSIKKICNKKLWVILGTVFYGTCPYIFLWNKFVLTESLSISFVVFLIYLTVTYLKKPKRCLAFFIGIIIFFMVMLRPAFLYLIPIYLVFWIFRFFNYKVDKHSNIVGMCSIFLTIIGIIVYVCMIKSQFNFWGLSCVNRINDIVMSVKTGSYKLSSNSEIVELIDREFEKNNDFNGWDALELITTNYDDNEINYYLKTIKSKNLFSYGKYVLKNAMYVSYSSLGTRYIDFKDYSSPQARMVNDIFIVSERSILPFTFLNLYVLLLLVIVYFVWLIFKNKKISYILAFFIATIFANVFTIIVASPGEFTRLFSPSLSLLIMMVAYLLSIIHESIDSNKVNDLIKKI